MAQRAARAATAPPVPRTLSRPDALTITTSGASAVQDDVFQNRPDGDREVAGLIWASQPTSAGRRRQQAGPSSSSSRPMRCCAELLPSWSSAVTRIVRRRRLGSLRRLPGRRVLRVAREFALSSSTSESDVGDILACTNVSRTSGPEPRGRTTGRRRTRQFDRVDVAPSPRTRRACRAFRAGRCRNGEDRRPNGHGLLHAAAIARSTMVSPSAVRTTACCVVGLVGCALDEALRLQAAQPVGDRGRREQQQPVQVARQHPERWPGAAQRREHQELAPVQAVRRGRPLHALLQNVSQPGDARRHRDRLHVGPRLVAGPRVQHRIDRVDGQRFGGHLSRWREREDVVGLHGYLASLCHTCLLIVATAGRRRRFPAS